MKTKKVYRYYCDYCKKSGCSKRHLQHHEERCTLNPHRICGYCKLLDQEQPEIDDLLAILPSPEKHSGYGNALYAAIEDALPKLREAAGGCPACILAALRQKGIPVPMATNFDFKKECQEIWDEINAKSMKQEIDSYHYY